MTKVNRITSLTHILKCDGRPDILCDTRLWLPRNASEDLRISILAMGTKDIDSIFTQKPLTLKSETYKENPHFEVNASGVHIKKITGQAFPRKASGPTIELLHIAELTIDSTISAVQPTTRAKDTEPIEKLYFHLSNLQYAQPDVFAVPDYLGNRKVNIKKTYGVKCSNNSGFDGELRLEKHYSIWQKHGPNKETVYSSGVFVWHGKESTSVFDIPFLLSLTEDVCLLLTFAARHRVMVLGYDYTTQHREFQHFRNPLDRNRIEREETGRNELIPLAEFETFMQTAVTSWGNLNKEGKDSIRLAIVALHPLTERSPERDYLAMFSALEGLSKLYKDEVVSELENFWKDIKDALSECIDSQTLISLDAKIFLQKNLSALKQGKKLEVRMKNFFKSQNVYIDDLWPVFGEDKLPDLYWVRNELAHGQHFSDKRFDAFLKANEHMSLVLERVVLCVLGFNPQRTTSGTQALLNQGRRLSKDQLKEFQMRLRLQGNL